MRIATWNVNGLRARTDFLLHWLRDRRPDVVGLQELKMEDDRFPHDLFEAEGYRALTHGQKSWNGVAILSRHPIELIDRGLPGQPELGSRLLTAAVGEMIFTTLYCPNGKSLAHPDYERKLSWLASLRRHLEPSLSADSRHVVCGDFNICPEPLDSWNEERFAGDIFHTEAERERLRQILDLGLVDLFRHRHPDLQAFSWWDYRGGAFHRKQGLRIDFLLASPGLAETTTHVEIDREYRKKKEGLAASDHAPVIADLEL